MLIPYINQRNGVKWSLFIYFPRFRRRDFGGEIKFLWDQALGFWKIHPIPWEPKAFMFSGAENPISLGRKKSIHNSLWSWGPSGSVRCVMKMPIGGKQLSFNYIQIHVVHTSHWLPSHKTSKKGRLPYLINPFWVNFGWANQLIADTMSLGNLL